MSDLAQKRCIACEGDVIPFNKTEAQALLGQLKGWSVSEDGKTLSQKFAFKDFKEALAFTDAIGAIAESEGHHPDLSLGWGRVEVLLTTHAIKGLSENDFILAAKIDEIVK